MIELKDITFFCNLDNSFDLVTSRPVIIRVYMDKLSKEAQEYASSTSKLQLDHPGRLYDSQAYWLDHHANEEVDPRFVPIVCDLRELHPLV